MTPYKELNEKEVDKEIKKYGVNRDFWQDLMKESQKYNY